MILRQFVSNSPFLLGAAPAIAVGVLVPAGMGQRLDIRQMGVPGDALFTWCISNQVICAVVAAVLITAIAWLINGLFNRYEFYSAPVFAPSLLCAVALVTGSLYSLHLPALAAMLLFLAAMYRLLGVYRQPVVLRACVESAFFSGLAALVFPPSLAVLPGLLLALAITRSFNWREFVVVIIGFALPFLYWFVYKFWFRELDELFLFVKSWDRHALISDMINLDMKWYGGAILVVLMLALPRYYFPGERLSNKSQNTRRVFMVVALAFAASVGISVWLQAMWCVVPVVLMFAVVTSAWFSNYRYSLIAPFVFYAYLATCAWLIWHMW
jgi:hypothetical protein